MDIGVIGINHKLAPLAIREMIAKAAMRRFSLENPLRQGSFVLLSTCNRSELYFQAPSLAASHEQILEILKEEIEVEFDQKLYTFFGFDCFLHLAKVTAGLDSAIIAETEIQGQVRCAYEAATTLRPLSKDLHFLFQKSLKIAKDVRREHLVSCHVPDLEHAIFWQAKDFFKDEDLPAPLFIGTSEINLKIARFLQRKGISNMCLSNRTEATSLRYAEQLGISVLPWGELKTKCQNYSWIIAATKSPHLILQNVSLQDKKTLLIDLAVPRNIDPNLAGNHCKVLNIDDLNLLLEKRKALLNRQITLAEQHLTLAVKRSVALYRSKASLLPLAVSC